MFVALNGFLAVQNVAVLLKPCGHKRPMLPLLWLHYIPCKTIQQPWKTLYTTLLLLYGVVMCDAISGGFAFPHEWKRWITKPEKRISASSFIHSIKFLLLLFKIVKLLSEMFNEAAVITSHPFPANILVMQLQKNKHTLIKHVPHMPYFHTAFGCCSTVQGVPESLAKWIFWINLTFCTQQISSYWDSPPPKKSDMFKVCNLSGGFIVIACPRHQKTQLCHYRLGMKFKNVTPQREVEFRNIPRHRRQTVYVQTHFFFCIFKGDATLFTLSMKWAIIFLFT